jgi:Na+/proline symporter
VFFSIGTALYVFYRQNPGRLDPVLQNDAIFPYFMMAELPAGVAGLIVAGIFAAAQSTLASSMNSVATAYVTDFHRRFRPGRDDGHYLGTARWATVFIGGAGTTLALIMAATDIRSFYTAFLEVLGLLGGTLSGLFLLGIFSTRANGTGALIGAVASAAVVFTVRSVSPLNVYAYAPIGLTSCLLFGWIGSRLLPAAARDLAGLTFKTLKRQT